MLRSMPLHEADVARPFATQLTGVGGSEFFQSLDRNALRPTHRTGAAPTRVCHVGPVLSHLLKERS
jgi:hypothetical protein